MGEISPKLRSSPDLEIYNRGVEELTNFETTPFGSVKRRKGSELISTISDVLTYGRIFTFRVEGSESYIISVTEDEITIHDRKGNIPTETQMINPGFNDGGDGWNVNILKDSADAVDDEPRITFLNGVCKIVSGNAAVLRFDFDDGPITIVNIEPCSAELTQQVTVAESGNIHSLKLTIVDTSFLSRSIVTNHLSLGTAEGLSDIPFTIDPLDSNNVIFTPGIGTFWISYRLDWDDFIRSNGGIVQNRGGGRIGVSAEIEIDSFTLRDTEAPAPFNVIFPSPYTEQEVRELQTEKAPGQSIMYFAVRSEEVTKKLIFDRDINAWSFVDVSFTSPPPTWDADGYPGSLTFFQGRLWLAGSKGAPATVWGSVAGEDSYEDFTAAGAEDDDSLELPLARDGVIQWIQGGKALIIGTDTAEHIIFGNAQFDLLTPGSARATQHSAYGSHRVHAKWLSEKISFISQDQQRIYVGDYDRNTFGFLSDELSYMAEHITKEGILEAAYGQNPRAHIWLVKQNGNVVGCTYQRETSAVGWHRYATPFGLIKSVTITEEFGRSVTWYLIERQNKLFLERASDDIFVDSHIIRQYVDPVILVDGLEHFENLVVDVIGDGAYAGRHVVENGEVTVQHEAKTFVVGIPFNSRMVTLPIEVLNASDNLTSKLVRWNKIFVRLIGSIVPLVNGVRPPTRTAPTPMDTREPNKNIDIEVSTIGWDRDGKIIIEQDLPFDCEVVGVYGELSEDGF